MLHQLLYTYTHSRPLRLTTALIIGLLVIASWWGLATSLNAPSAPTDPASQSYTLADICNQLQTGAAPTIATTFTEPDVAPDQDMCSLNDIYASTPQPDTINAAQAADVLSTKTFWALNPSGQWGLTTGIATAFSEFAVLPATGQNTCYTAGGVVISCIDTGQDGEYQSGDTASPRFTDNSNGTVTDNLTGLIWLKNAQCFGARIWENALDDANNLASGSCGLTDGSVAGDWRLPNKNELWSLVDIQNNNPSLPSGHPFTNVFNGSYWSSTTKVYNPSDAWYIRFEVGVDTGNASYAKSSAYPVWPVR